MIHILGAGSIGSLLALSLARKFPVEFLLRPQSYRSFVDVGKSTVQMHLNGAVFENQIGAREILPPGRGAPFEISKLIVAVKTHDVVKALHSVRPHLSPATEVLVVHNGMGVLEWIREAFDGPLPRLAFGVTDANVARERPLWKFHYTGRGVNYVSQPENADLGLFANLASCSELAVTEQVPWTEFVHRQKRKLAINAVVNPLTALLQCRNGALLEFDEHGLLPRLIAETSRVLGLDRKVVTDIVQEILERSAPSITSMLADVDAGRPSEIENINGFVVREAHRQGMSAPLNQMLRDLVHMRILQVRREMDAAVPHVA